MGDGALLHGVRSLFGYSVASRFAGGLKIRAPEELRAASGRARATGREQSFAHSGVLELCSSPWGMEALLHVGRSFFGYSVASRFAGGLKIRAPEELRAASGRAGAAGREQSFAHSGVLELCSSPWGMEALLHGVRSFFGFHQPLSAKSSAPHPAEPEPPGASRASRTPECWSSARIRRGGFSSRR